ncbi:MAG: PilZ domain-containing protein [Spirochaetota bacterium]
MSEKREFPRVDFAFQVSILPGATAEGTNLSQKGIGLRVSEKCEIDSIIELQLHAPGFTGEVDIKGKVTRCEPVKDEYEVGIVFADVDEETQNFIYEYIDSQLSILS